MKSLAQKVEVCTYYVWLMTSISRKFKKKNREEFDKTDKFLKKIELESWQWTHDTWQFRSTTRFLQQLESQVKHRKNTWEAMK
jgi:hypothetical protein